MSKSTHIPPTPDATTVDAVAIVWNQFGPYHMDRCEALGALLTGRYSVHGIEISSQSQRYAWAETDHGQHFSKHTLFPGQKFEDTRAIPRLLGIIRACWRVRAKHVFLTNYDRFEIFLAALSLRLLGRRVYLLCVSKFDDKPRRVWFELLKLFVLLPYNGALAAGPRAESYLRFLGFRSRPIATGFNTVGLARIVDAAGASVTAEEAEFSRRHFVLVGRFIAKKDIATAIAAYARYRALAGDGAREFHICGSGPLEEALRAQIAELNLQGVVLHGFLQREGIARVLAGGLALVLPSVEEQWGLVVNEALAFCLPILATDQVGARDLLIRTGVNGYIFEPGNVEGLAHLMLSVAGDESEWRRLVNGSCKLRQAADVERFAAAVLALMEA